MDDNGVVHICLKKKLTFKSHVLFEAIRSTVLHGVLHFLEKKITRYIVTLILTLIIYLGNGSTLWKVMKMKIFQNLILQMKTS